MLAFLLAMAIPVLSINMGTADDGTAPSSTTQRKAYAEELRALGTLRTQFRDDPLVRLLVGAAIHHTEANLRVLDQADEDLPELAAKRTPARVDAQPAQRRAGGQT